MGRRPRVSTVQVLFLHTWRDLMQRVREQSRPTLSWTLRLTVAATSAYVVATQFFDYQPLLAPLSALLVTQLTLYSVLRHGISRVVSVVAGVLIATAFASVVGLTWWSLAIAIAIGLLIGQLLRLGDHIIEVPVTAMFVMAVQAGTTTAALDRVMSTTVGAAIGLLINILIPPGERSPSAAAAVRRYAEEIGKTIRAATAHMDGEVTREQAQAWLDRSRSLDYKTVHIDRFIDHAAEARVLNIRAMSRPNSIRALRSGLYSLEHSAVAIRGVFRGISDAVWYPGEGVEDPLPEEAREITQRVLNSIADVVVEFGSIVEAHVQKPTVEPEEALFGALERLRDVRLEADRRLDSKLDPLAVRELLAFLVVASGRILREFDVRAHTWLHPEPAPRNNQRLRAFSVAKGLQAQLRLMKPSRKAPPDSSSAG